MKIIAKKI